MMPRWAEPRKVSFYFPSLIHSSAQFLTFLIIIAHFKYLHMQIIITPYSIYKRYLFGFRDDKGQYKMRNFRFLQNRADILPQGDRRICDDCMVRE